MIVFLKQLVEQLSTLKDYLEKQFEPTYALSPATYVDVFHFLLSSGSFYRKNELAGLVTYGHITFDLLKYHYRVGETLTTSGPGEKVRLSPSMDYARSDMLCGSLLAHRLCRYEEVVHPVREVYPAQRRIDADSIVVARTTAGPIFVLDGYGYHWNGDRYKTYSVERQVAAFEVSIMPPVMSCAVELTSTLKGDDRYQGPQLPEANFCCERDIDWLVHIFCMILELG